MWPETAAAEAVILPAETAPVAPERSSGGDPITAKPQKLPDSSVRQITISTVSRRAVETLVARYTTGNIMQTEPDDTILAGPEDPADQAREAVEAMRARGTNRPDVERAILGAGEAHARFLQSHGMSPEDWR